MSAVSLSLRPKEYRCSCVGPFNDAETQRLLLTSQFKVAIMIVDTDVLIIGAGLSGVGFAIQLQKKYPRIAFEIYEKAEGLGGTWWANTYPGCACDVGKYSSIFIPYLIPILLGTVPSLFLFLRPKSRLERAVCVSSRNSRILPRRRRDARYPPTRNTPLDGSVSNIRRISRNVGREDP